MRDPLREPEKVSYLRQRDGGVGAEQKELENQVPDPFAESETTVNLLAHPN